jgi:hypothetical protein
MQVPITRDVRENPIATASTCTTFKTINKEIILRLCRKNQENDARIKELEQKLLQMKIDERGF